MQHQFDKYVYANTAYVLCGQSKMGKVVSAVAQEGAYSASYPRLPQTLTRIKQTKRQADILSPACLDERWGRGVGSR